MTEIKPGEPFAIAIDRACGSCRRSSDIMIALHRLMDLAGLTTDDVEDAALIACDGCAEDAQCVRMPDGWMLEIARAEVQAAA